MRHTGERSLAGGGGGGGGLAALAVAGSEVLSAVKQECVCGSGCSREERGLAAWLWSSVTAEVVVLVGLRGRG